MLCAITASALSYASPYKGAGRSGYVYTTSSARVQNISSAGMAQVPIASMTSTGGMRTSSRGIAYDKNSTASPAIAVCGIRTSASSLSGGQLSSYTYSQMRGLHKAKKEDPDTPPSPSDPGYCGGCAGHYVWDPSLNGGHGGWICSSCGCELKDGCDCDEESGYCWCPVGEGKDVWLFIAALAAAYAIYRNKVSKEIEIQNI